MNYFGHVIWYFIKSSLKSGTKCSRGKISDGLIFTLYIIFNYTGSFIYEGWVKHDNLYGN